MQIELSEKLEAALVLKANAQGVSAAGYVRDVLERDLAIVSGAKVFTRPLKSGRGSFAKYGLAPSAAEIRENRADIFQHFGEID